jgi:catechol 2,3-dioxygenase-like lactoylglutathione lyase family enzyme
MTISFALVVIRAADLHISRQFYEAIGLSFATERHGSGPEHLVATLGGTVFEIYPRGEGPSSAGVRLGLRVASVSAAVAAVEQLGSKIASPVKEGAHGLRAVVVDPDGHRVEISE